MGCISVLFPAVELSLTGAYRLRRCVPRRNEAQAGREWIAAPAARGGGRRRMAPMTILNRARQLPGSVDG